MGAKGPPFTGGMILKIASPVKGGPLAPMERCSPCFDSGGGGSGRRVVCEFFIYELLYLLDGVIFFGAATLPHANYSLLQATYYY